MIKTYNVSLISDSTGETLDRIFVSLKAQFGEIKYVVQQFSFIRTENQISKIVEKCVKKKNPIILFTIVDTSLSDFLKKKCLNENIPCYGALEELIIVFSKLLKKEASHIPSGQHQLNDEYYKRIEAIQFTMNHDDGNSVDDLDKSDIILLGVSRTSKTPTSIYLANRGFKTSNIPIVNKNSIPNKLQKNPKLSCVIGLTTDPERLVDIRKNRMSLIKEDQRTTYTNLTKIIDEVKEAKKIFKRYNWPIIDVTRKSVEEVAASIIKIHEIDKTNE
tara:strand:- start:824 stop:1648 length:825 start_codon:yes stop_codon:yes gene_type:complete